MKRSFLIALAITLVVELAPAQEAMVRPPDNVKVDGVPTMPASLGDIVQRYRTSSPDSLVGWDPVKVQPIFIRQHYNNGWELASVAEPGGTVNRIRFLRIGTYDAYENERRGYFIFDVDTAAGAEHIQLFRYDVDKSSLILLTDGKSKNYNPVFSNSGDTMMYSSNRRNGKDMDLYIINPLDPKSDRMIAQLDGEDWTALDWSPDDKEVILSEYLMSGESYLWIFDITTQTKTRLTDPLPGGRTFNGFYAQFNKDGKGVYHITDRESEFQRLAYVDIATKRYSYLTEKTKWDVDKFRLSPDRKLLAYTTNENGFSRLRVINLANKNRELPLREVPSGVIDKLRWHNNGEHLGFGVSSGTVPSDICSLEVRSGKLQRWTTSAGIVSDDAPKPEQLKWRSFDGKSIQGFLYRPPAKFTGCRPVIINVHGGPNAQFRPTFREGDNYFTSELGAVMIYPNVRGSTGYGKAYLESDDGYLRENAVRDIGSLLDWIKAQRELDADRVLIRGESYGGYVALSASAKYSDRIRGTISISGPSNLVTYLEKTDISRQDRRRAEYGDERDPNMRKFLENIAPFNRADKIRNPLLVIQGKNDTRVVFSESEKMVEAVRKNGTSVWYLLATNEGHGFSSTRTIHFALCVQVFFATKVLGGRDNSSLGPLRITGFLNSRKGDLSNEESQIGSVAGRFLFVPILGWPVQ